MCITSGTIRGLVSILTYALSLAVLCGCSPPESRTTTPSLDKIPTTLRGISPDVRFVHLGILRDQYCTAGYCVQSRVAGLFTYCDISINECLAMPQHKLIHRMSTITMARAWACTDMSKPHLWFVPHTSGDDPDCHRIPGSTSRVLNGESYCLITDTDCISEGGHADIDMIQGVDGRRDCVGIKMPSNEDKSGPL